MPSRNHVSYLAGIILLALASGAQAVTPTAAPTFTGSTLSAPPATGAYTVAVGDFDGNGKPDLAVANYSSGSVTIWLGNGSGGFTQPTGSPLAATVGVAALAVTDINGDGKADLVAAYFIGPSTNNVAVWLGNGDGTFGTVKLFSAGTGPQFVAVGDFNGDGRPDLAVANINGNNVSILINTTAGGATTASFAATANFPAGSSPVSVAIGDFNGDGHQDLAIADEVVSGTVTVLLGNGSGSFSAASYSPVSVGSLPSSVAVGDFDGDGHQDLAIAVFGIDRLVVMLGSGTGFTAAMGSPFTTGHFPNAAVVGDFNGDGNLDVATANYGAGNATVLLGNGSGGFTAAAGSPFAAGTNAQAIAAGDFNRDGEPDLVIANFGANDVTLLLSSSPAITAKPSSVTFWASATGQGAIETVAIAAAGTGYQVNDILTAVGGGGSGASFKVTHIGAGGAVASIIPVSGGSGYTSSPGFAGGHGVGFIINVTSFLNNTAAVPAGIPVTVNSSVSGSVYTAASNQPWVNPSSPISNATGGPTPQTLSASQSNLPAGTYTANVRYTSPNFFDGKTSAVLNVTNPTGTLVTSGVVQLALGFPNQLAVGDFNLDGKPDLVLAFNATGGADTVVVLLGDGSGNFNTPGNSFVVGEAPSSIAIGDFNGDGKPDLAVANDLASGTVTILLGDGTGSFKPALGGPFPVGENPQSVAVGDFNGDGKPDLAVANFSSGNVTVLLGNGLGGFAPAPGSPVTVAFADSVAVGDFNGDGKQDLAVATNNQNLMVLLGNGLGGFTPALNSPFAIGAGGAEVVVADFNGDGKQDLATANLSDSDVTVMLGDGAGGFSPAVNIVVPSPISLVVADFNGDGKPDLATVAFSSPTVTVLLGNGAGGFAQATVSPALNGLRPVFLAAGDFNGDGRPDLATPNSSSDLVVTVLLGASATTTSTLTAVPLAQAYGLPVTFSATVIQTGFNSPTGSVTIVDNATADIIGSGSPPPTVPITNAVSTPGGIEITAPGHGLTTGQTVTISGVNGTTEANGTWNVLVVDPNNFTLLGALFMNTYTGGGLVLTPFEIQTASLGIGIHTLIAVYTGDARNTGSTSSGVTVTINRAAQFITFGPLMNLSFGGPPFTIGATVNSPLAVTFISNTTSVCGVSGNLVTIFAAGQCSITANQVGNQDYLTATPVTNTFTVTSAAAVAAFLDQNGAPALTFNGSTNFPDAGGFLIGAPGVAQAVNGDTYIVGLDGAGGVHLNSYSYANQVWNGWQYSGGILDNGSLPGHVATGLTVAVAPNGVVWFTGRDIGNRYWINSWNGTSFGGWILMDGAVQGVFAGNSIPQIAIPSDGSIYVIGTDIGNRVWSTSYIPGTQTFTGFVDRQGVIVGQPSVTAGQDGMVYVAVRSVSSESPVYITQIPANNGPNNPNVQSGSWWINGGGQIDTDPQIASVGGKVYIAALADGGTVYLDTFAESNQTFGGYVFTGGILNDISIADQGGNVYIAGRDGSDRIYWYSAVGNSFFLAGGAGVSSTVLAGGK